MSTRALLIPMLSLVVVAATPPRAHAQENGQGLITLDPPIPPAGYLPDQTVTAAITAEIADPPVNDPVVLRGIQLDFQPTTGLDLPPEFDFNDPGGGPWGGYVEFPALPQPNMVWIPFFLPSGLMINLSDGPQFLGWITFNTTDVDGILSVADPTETDPNFGMSLKFGFGVDDNDPLTDWRFDNAGLIGDNRVDIPVVPEPATLALLALVAAATRRRYARERPPR